MTKLCQLLLFMALPWAVRASEPCSVTSIKDEATATKALDDSTPEAQDAGSRACIVRAIDLLSELRSKKAIPELIRYLSFERDRAPEENNGLFLHVPFEGYDQPAVLALARIAEPARVALLDTIKSDSAVLSLKQSAAHALALSFLYDPEQNPGKAILYLRDTERNTDNNTRAKLEQAVSYVLNTQACKRFASKCTEADRQSALK